jgi:hypothetical protein
MISALGDSRGHLQQAAAKTNGPPPDRFRLAL